MGIFDFIKKQFIDVIEWVDEKPGVLAYQYPMQDQEIQTGAKLTVREGQAALFVNEGKIADQFYPGLHTLSTKTLPILTNLLNWDKLFASPFKSDVFFYSLREQLGQPWGTPNAITVRDKQFGMARIQAHGNYSYKIADPKKMFPQLVAGKKAVTTEDLADQLRGILVGAIATTLGAAQSFVDLASNQIGFAQTVLTAAKAEFSKYGLELTTVQILGFTLPPELQKRLDEQMSIGMVSDMAKYTQFQAATSIPLAAANEGGVAGIGAGIGVGAALAQSMTSAFATVNSTGVASGTKSASATALLEELHALHTKGILTDEEYANKKAEVLKRL